MKKSIFQRVQRIIHMSRGVKIEEITLDSEILINRNIAQNLRRLVLDNTTSSDIYVEEIKNIGTVQDIVNLLESKGCK